MPTALNGYLNSAKDITLRDWQHAARLYVDDTYRLAPKPKWIHYAVFNINPAAISGSAFQGQQQKDLNYLAKRFDLPKFTLNVENLNQYNRKTSTYTRITYEPVNIVFHDDNNQTTKNLWASYYRYYFADGKNGSELNNDTSPPAYKVHTYDSKETFPYRYGLDNDSVDPYFLSIQLVTMSKQRFTSYLLCNPKILSWQHDTPDQSEGNGLLENLMNVTYDAVIYSDGRVSYDNPKGFVELYYDTTESWLSNSNQGNTTTSNISGYQYSSNAANTIDNSISTIRALRQNLENTGNQLPYGYGASLSAPGPVNSPYSTSGFQNYNFGSQNAQLGLSGVLSSAVTPGYSALRTTSNFASASSALSANTTGLTTTQSRAGTFYNVNPIQFAPVDRYYSSGQTVRSQAIRYQFDGFVSSNNASPSISDVYKSNLPDNTPNAVESKIFANVNRGINLPEPLTSVSMDYYSQNDQPRKQFISEELVNNSPIERDLPDDYFN